MNYWLVATYKLKEVKKLESNLQNQKFNYYLPKIFTQKINQNIKKEPLFPGYVFINATPKNYNSLKYTKGIKNIVRFGNNFSYMSDNEIKRIKKIEDASRENPINTKISIGQEVVIKNGFLKGNIVKICSLPSKKRVSIFLYILGLQRKVNLAVNDLSF